jgi:hypothetical protein
MPLPAANPTHKQVIDRFRDWNKPTDFLVIGNQLSLDGPTISGSSLVHQNGLLRTMSGGLGRFKTQTDALAAAKDAAKAHGMAGVQTAGNEWLWRNPAVADKLSCHAGVQVFTSGPNKYKIDILKTPRAGGSSIIVGNVDEEFTTLHEAECEARRLARRWGLRYHANYRGNYVFNEALKDDTLGATAAHWRGFPRAETVAATTLRLQR